MNWTAKWIWNNGEASPRNLYWCARKEFELAKSFGKVSLAISADARYSLWINGRYVGHGPVRAFAGNWRYDEYDLTPYVSGGRNAIAVLVHHPGHSNFQYLEARGGLLAQLECDGQVIAATDSSWRGSVHPSYLREGARICCQQGWVERFDARVEPQGWTEAGFDDSAWKQAVLVGEVGCAPWTKLSPRDIPFLTQEPVYPVRIMRTQVVTTPKQVWAMDLKPNLIPGDLTANHGSLFGLVASMMCCSQPMKISIACHFKGFPALWIDGASVSWADAEKGVEISKGEHLFLVDVTGLYHEWSANFVFDYEDGELSFRNPLNESAEYPFVSVGPFGPGEEKALEDSRGLGSIQAIAEHPKVKPILPEHVDLMNVGSRTSRAKPNPAAEADIREPEALLAANENVATILPVAGGDTEILIDFGKEIVGFMEMELCAPEGVVIDFDAFENIYNGEIQWTGGLNNDFRYTTREGWQQWRSVVRRGFRYALLVARFPEGCKAPIQLKTLRCHLNVYPYSERGQFHSSDALLDKAWDISRWTVTLCSEDTFVDCPAYEQTFWVGDARNESLFSYTGYGDTRLARRCLLLVGESLWRSPLVESQVPSGWQNILTAWSLMWTVACEEHYRYTGDMEFMEEIYPAVRLQNENILSQFINKDGLLEITAWNMLDWAPMDTPGAGVVTHQNMWLVKALHSSAKMADILGKSDDAKRYRSAAAALREAINKHLWVPEKQGYRDCIHADGTPSQVFSQQTQTIAYLCDVAPEDKRELFERYLTDVPEGWVEVGSPFMMAFTLEALEKAGSRDRILDLIRKWWGMMIDNDATACWETFPNALGHGRFTRSYCHAWSAAPAFSLPTYVLGVRPLDPGFATFEIDPYLGDLRFARGAVPTPYGEVSVSLAKEDDSIQMSFSVPAGTTAMVRGTRYSEGTYTISI